MTETTESIEDFDFTHPRIVEERKRFTGPRTMTHADIWPDQEHKSGRPRSIGWTKIIDAVAAGVGDVCQMRDLEWQILISVKTRNNANKLISRLRRDYAPYLPSGEWDFMVDVDPFEEDNYYVKARYSPRKFSDIENIYKIPSDLRFKLLQDLREYAERMRKMQIGGE